MTLLQMAECYQRDQVQSLPLLLSNLYGMQPLKNTVFTPDSLLQDQKAADRSNKDLGELVLQLLSAQGMKDQVALFKSNPDNSQLAEIRHMLEMCQI